MRHVVANVGRHAHHVKGCVNGPDLKLAIAFVRFLDIVFWLHLQPVAINHEVNVRIKAGALSNCRALVDFVGDSCDAIKLFDERFIPEDREENVRRSRIKDGVNATVDLCAFLHHLIGECLSLV